MSSNENEIEGITSGGKDKQVPEDVPELEEIIADLEGVETLRGLQEALEKEVLEGIERTPESEDVRTGRFPGTISADVDLDELTKNQLKELQQIQNTNQLLRRLIAAQSNTNQILSSVLTSSLTKVVQEIGKLVARGTVLTIKEAKQRNISNSNNPQDVLASDDISTATVIVKADPSNSGVLWIGKDGVQANDGYLLEAGEERPFPVDILETDFKIVAEDDDEDYSYIALGAITN